MQTELHRHIDVAVRTSTVLELAQERGLEPTSTSVEAFREKLIMRKPMTDLNEVLAQFTIFQQILDRPDVIDRIAFEAVEDCRAEGTRLVEFRFAPSFVCELSHLPWEDALDGFESGLKRALEQYPEMRAGLICITLRNGGIDEVERTMNFFLKHQHRFVGVDLAGNEADFPSRIFHRPFQRAMDAGANITIHAGEAAGPENIWEAIELLGAKRIGHGVAAIQDSELMKVLAEKQICLEMCPTSNWLTQCTPDLSKHPLPRVLRAGVPVCLNTDDPGMFGVTLPQEAEICRNVMGMSDKEIQALYDHGRRASFVTISE